MEAMRRWVERSGSLIEKSGKPDKGIRSTVAPERVLAATTARHSVLKKIVMKPASVHDFRIRANQC